MTAIANARYLVLGRIRRATASSGVDPAEVASQYAKIPREYIRAGSLTHALKVALLIERLAEYGAEVVESTPNGLPAEIHARLSASGRHTFVVPPALPPAWMSPEFNWLIDRGLGLDEIEKSDGVVTAAFCAIADSGTIALHHSASEGRRVLTLLPDWHLCVLFTSQIVETFPEYFARARQSPAPVTPGLVTWISGPSATADIEMTRIKGVHGPRQLSVILVHDQP